MIRLKSQPEANYSIFFKGFGIPDGARILLELMRRIGHEQFYVQGGDIGAMIGTVMAQVYPGWA